MNVFITNNSHTLWGLAATGLSALAVGLGIVAAKKSGEVKREAEFDIMAAEDSLNEGTITTEEFEKEKAAAKKTELIKTAAWYSLPILCEASSVACIFMGQRSLVTKNNVLLDQNNQLMANLAAVTGSIAKQKEVFKQALGDEKYREIANGITEETHELISEKSGKPVKKKVKLIDKDHLEDSSFIFGPYKMDGTPNPKWNASLEENYTYIESMQDYFTNILESKFIIFRNDVVSYFDDSIDAQTEAGQYIGKTASMRNPGEVDVRLCATDYMMRDPHGNLVDCLLVQTNLNDSVARYLK